MRNRASEQSAAVSETSRSSLATSGADGNRNRLFFPHATAGRGRHSRALLEKFSGGGDVVLDLFAQRIKGGELLFVAQFSGKDDL